MSQSNLSLTILTMTLLARLPIHQLKKITHTLWAKPLDSEESCVYLLEIIGSIKCISEQSPLILKEPIGDPLLHYIFEAQQENLRLIADEIRQIGDAMDDPFLCDSATIISFDNNRQILTSTLHLNIPADMIHKLTYFEEDDLIKSKCSIGFTRHEASLQLTAQSIETISKIHVTLE